MTSGTTRSATPVHRVVQVSRWRVITVTADEFIRRFLKFVLLVAAKPLPVPANPACPRCGQPMTYLGFVSAPEGLVMIHDSS